MLVAVGVGDGTRQGRSLVNDKRERVKEEGTTNKQEEGEG